MRPLTKGSISMFLRALLLSIICLFNTALHSYQPYNRFNPVPQPEIGLNQKKASALFIETTSTAYTQLAHEAFLDHLKERHPLSALYFNKSDFRLSTIFQDCLAPTNTENYNPYIRVLPLSPRISFSEIGTHIAWRAEAGIGKKKWLHVGVRASIALKRQEITRNDSGSRGPAERQDIMSQAEIRFPDDEIAIPNAMAYRFDFIEALPDFTSGDFQESVQYDGNDPDVLLTIFGYPVSETESTVTVAFLAKKETHVPKAGDIGTLPIPYGTAGTQIAGYLPHQLSSIVEQEVYEVGPGLNDYTHLLDSAPKSVSQRIADQDAKAKLWLISSYEGGSPSSNFDDINTAVTQKIDQYNENVYEWFHDREYDLSSQLCQGIGDTKLEAYLAADLFDTFQVRILGGAVLPTARQKTTGKSPYAIHLGNRGHVEFFVGGGITLAIPHTQWFITSDAQYTTALSAIEYISATSRGALIKNMGPETRADISWHSTQGNVWLHMQHPATNSLSFAVGYEWYSKIEDTLIFLDTDINSFLGNTFNSTSRKYDTANPITLDPDIAKNHTGAISHTVRLSTTYTPSPYIKLCASAGYVLGGRNTPQIIECALGCTISF